MTNEKEYVNTYGNPSYEHRPSAKESYEAESGVGSFLVGATIGALAGAVTALLLAPKSGREMREDISTQAIELKDKTIELTAVAKEKAEEFAQATKEKTDELTQAAKEKTDEITQAAKEKTDEVTKVIKEKTGEVVDKVKGEQEAPLDDGTASTEGEEPLEEQPKEEEK